MYRPPFFSNWQKVKSISFGVVYVMLNIWIMTHITNIAPAGNSNAWWKVYATYGIMSAWVFGNADMRNKLFNVKLIKMLPRLLIFFGISLLLFWVILAKTARIDIMYTQIMTSIPLHLAIAHAFLFATTETVIWQGYLDESIGRVASGISAGIFHMYIWAGAPIIALVGATLLFWFFSYINLRWRQSKDDLAPALGSHIAYNYVKLAVVLGGVV